MTQPTLADTLRAAAQKLRAHVAAAAEESGSTTWHAVRHFPHQPDSTFTALEATGGRSLLGGGGGRGRPPAYVHAPVGDYIALMHPGVGLAVVRWLESWAGVEFDEHGPMPEDAQHALAVARQILGEQP